MVSRKPEMGLVVSGAGQELLSEEPHTKLGKIKYPHSRLINSGTIILEIGGLAVTPFKTSYANNPVSAVDEILREAKICHVPVISETEAGRFVIADRFSTQHEVMDHNIANHSTPEKAVEGFIDARKKALEPKQLGSAVSRIESRRAGSGHIEV